ncbi:MAG: dihydrolipoyl dehydrogenase [Deltaproteobacteria bacterium CG11_big_fil_rev_8_21_14_0_20_45_16]|nr:MAG: dihydrolipoyl dehydrogenase [Deltaproteobacteria bacterium CG11_big_fil_rev_8_21_14_0_20_45_16]
MKSFDAVVIGAGPGGYVCAIRLAQLGVKTALIDRDNLGGTCLNWGCIPSKALIHAAHLYETMHHGAKDMGFSFKELNLDFKKLNSWKDGVVQKLTQGIGGLCKRHGVEVFIGTAEFKSATQVDVSLNDGGKKESLQFKKAVIATGAASSSLPGINIDGKQIVTSKEALNLPELPKKMILIGGGIIGMELGCFYSMIGTEVTVLEYAPQILPGTDVDLVKPVEKAFVGRGGKIFTKFKVQSAEKKGKNILVRGTNEKSEEMTFEADIVLVSVGRKPFTDKLAIEKAGVKKDERGFIPVNRALQTNISNIYAIGDVTTGPALAHRASHEAMIAAAHVAGDAKSLVDYKVIPAATFTDPEIASVGISEAEAKAKGLNVKIGKFPFAALGRALANNHPEGFVKIIGDAKTNDLLGMHIVGPDAGNLIAEGALAMEMGASVEDLALTIHTHPTYPESVMEAAEAYFGHAIHVYQPGHSRSDKSSATA